MEQASNNKKTIIVLMLIALLSYGTGYLQCALNATNLFGLCCTLLPLGNIIFFAPKILSIFGAQYATSGAFVVASLNYLTYNII
jgi:hypothetical protein